MLVQMLRRGGFDAGSPSASIDIAAMGDPRHQDGLTEDREDDPILTDAVFAEAGELTRQFRASRRTLGQLFRQLREHPIGFRLVQPSQIARYRFLE